MLAIAALRTAMLLPVLAILALMILVVKQDHASPMLQRTILAAVAAGTLVAAPLIAVFLGSYEFNVGDTLQGVTSTSQDVAQAGEGWSENSIGLLFLPQGPLQAILYLPPRMVLYLLAPLPNVLVPVTELLAGTWDAWQRLSTLLSSMVNVLALPYVLASLVRSLRMRKQDVAPLVLHISYWVTFAAVAGGNVTIHERYRVMATLLFWGCAWLGARTCSRNEIRTAAISWYGALALGALLYLAYKGL